MPPAAEPSPTARGFTALPGAAPDLRASDAERDRVAMVLADALATGRLTPEEHAERLEATYHARTRGELVPLTRDLPEPTAGTGAEAAPPQPDSPPVVALFSKIRRGGQWPVPPHTVIRARFGAAVVDLRHAVFTRHEVVIDAGGFCGKVILVVPDNAQVYDVGSALFGKRSLPGGRGPKEPGGPVIRITGRSVLGHLRVSRGGFTWPFGMG